MRAWLAAVLKRKLAPVGVRLQLGTDPPPVDGPIVGDLIVHDARTLLGLAIYPDLYFGEAYMAGRLEVRGDLEKVLEAISTLSTPGILERVGARVSAANSLRIARRNVQHHYDLGNDFYQSWLDANLVYTCAYYEHPDASLDAAQRAKLDLVCRKLRLQPGENVVEAGCGWGALALHMAREYGVHVKAFNVSKEQIAYARERARNERLAHLVEFIDDDYRKVAIALR